MRTAFFGMPKAARFIFIPIMAAAFLALISFIVMQLWNHLLPDILHVQPINIWQAAGIFILCKILFGFGKPRQFGGNKTLFKSRLRERFKNMSPEERARFKEKFAGNSFDPCRNFNRDEERGED